MIDRGIIARYLLSAPSKNTNLEKSSHINVLKDSRSNRVIDLLIHNTIPIILYDNLSVFRGTGKQFDLRGVFLKTITEKNFNVGLASLLVKTLMFEFAKKKIHFDEKSTGNKSTRDRSHIRLLKSPDIMASGFSTIFFSENPNQL